MDAPLLSNEQVAAIVTAIALGAGGIATAIRWAVGRLVKSIDEGTADSKLVRIDMVELKATMHRVEAAIGRLDERGRRVRKAQTNPTGPTGVPRLRLPTDE